MEENKDKKSENSGKLQLKKTFNVGQNKQSFSHGRTRSVSVEIKKKRVLRSLNENNDLTNCSTAVKQNDGIGQELKLAILRKAAELKVYKTEKEVKEYRKKNQGKVVFPESLGND